MCLFFDFVEIQTNNLLAESQSCIFGFSGVRNPEDQSFVVCKYK
jgi:hypothetical protein